MKKPKKKDATHWIAPDGEWLKAQHLVQGKTLKQIAEEVGADEAVIQRWVRKLGVYEGLDRPYKVGAGSGMRFYGVTKEWLEERYIVQDMSAKQIGDEIGSSHNAVVKWLQKYGIELRDRTAMNDRHSLRMSGDGNPAWSGGTAQNYQAGALRESGRTRQCIWCRTTKDLQVHHLDHDTKNGDLNNLVWLCRNCNCLEAHAWNLVKKGRAQSFWYDKDKNQLVVQYGAEMP